MLCPCDGPASRSALEAAELFVSYTTTGSGAESIAWQLEADGYQVIVQVLDFTLVVSGPKGCKQRTFASR